MRVVMIRPRRLQDAGADRPLDIGRSYDLPDIVAQSLIATGAAVLEDGEPGDEEASLRPPEIKPMRAPEIRRPRRPE